MDTFDEMKTLIATFDAEEETPEKEKPDTEREEATYGCDYVARVIGVPVQTIRNYTKDYDEFLSSGRNENGQRSYTRRDGAVLKKIHELRTSSRMGKAEIKNYLSANVKLSPAAAKESRMIADAVTHELQEKIKAFFDIGMAGITRQVSRLSSHMDSMEGAVKKQKEEMKRLQEQNDALREEMLENKKMVLLLSKDMEKRAETQENLMQRTLETAKAAADTDVAGSVIRAVNEKMERMEERRQEDNNFLLKTVQDSSVNETLIKEQAEKEETYEKARIAVKRLAEEVDAKNAQIARLIKEKEALEQVAKERRSVKKKPFSGAVILDTEKEEAKEAAPLKTLDSRQDYVKSLKKVARKTPKEQPPTIGDRFFSLMGKAVKHA